MISKKLSCYVIDDEFHAIENLSDHILKIPNLLLIGSCSDPVEALARIRLGLKPDVLFLDINMPQLSGLQVAELIDDDIEIIFTTGYVNYAVDAFEKEALDFLLKPISFERFEKSIHRLLKSKLSSDVLNTGAKKSIYINIGSKGKFAHVGFDEIIFIESVGHYIMIQTHDEMYKTHLSIKDILDDLSFHSFSRVHKSFIVNLQMIKSFSGSQIILQGNFRVPIGDFYREALMDRLLEKKISKK
jgi:DNA-binding LytR/AlgR family response regulator